MGTVFRRVRSAARATRQVDGRLVRGGTYSPFVPAPWALLCLTLFLGTGLRRNVHAESNTTNIINGVATNAGATYFVGQSGPSNYLEIRSGGGLTNGMGFIGYTLLS